MVVYKTIWNGSAKKFGILELCEHHWLKLGISTQWLSFLSNNVFFPFMKNKYFFLMLKIVKFLIETLPSWNYLAAISYKGFSLWPNSCCLFFHIISRQCSTFRALYGVGRYREQEPSCISALSVHTPLETKAMQNTTVTSTARRSPISVPSASSHSPESGTWKLIVVCSIIMILISYGWSESLSTLPCIPLISSVEIEIEMFVSMSCWR